MNLLIKNCSIISANVESEILQDIWIAGGKIAAISPSPSAIHSLQTQSENIKSDYETIDAAGCYVTAGLIDLSARLREPGFEHKGALEAELNAALAGGVTTVVCPPDTDPALDEPGLVEMLKRRAKSVKLARVLPMGALTVGLRGEALTEMAELTEAGCVAFSQGSVPIANVQVLGRALAYAKSFGYRVWLRPVDARLGGGVAASGAVATRLGLPSIPVAAESIFLLTLFELLRSNPTPVHIQCISSARGVDLIRAAKAEGLPVTCDVSVYHLHLIDMDIGYFDAMMRLDPPLRGQRDRDALRAGLRDGTIDAICSDHTPVDEDEKQLPFGEASAGATGLELLLPLALKWAAEDGVSVADCLKKLNCAPAKVLGLNVTQQGAFGDFGILCEGAAADVVIFDANTMKTITVAGLRSQGKNTPYLGIELAGVVHATVVAGVVHRY